jgi:hypothetical protein
VYILATNCDVVAWAGGDTAPMAAITDKTNFEVRRIDLFLKK